MPVRAAGPAPRHRLRRPPGVPAWLHRRALPRGMGPVAVPRRRAAPGRRPAGGNGVRACRNGGGRRHAGDRQAVPGVPDEGVLGVAAEAGEGGAVLAAGAGVRGGVSGVPQDGVLDSAGLHAARPDAGAVRVLQAADVVRVQPQPRCGERGGGAGGGLLPVEERSRRAVLRVRVVQGRGAGAAAPPLAQRHHHQRRAATAAHRRLLLRLLRLPQCAPCRLLLRRHVQDPPTLGLLLVEVVAWPKRPALLTRQDNEYCLVWIELVYTIFGSINF